MGEIQVSLGGSQKDFAMSIPMVITRRIKFLLLAPETIVRAGDFHSWSFSKILQPVSPKNWYIGRAANYFPKYKCFWRTDGRAGIMNTQKVILKKMKFQQLARDEKIDWGDYHSTDNGEVLCPIANEETIGQYPSQFAKDRSFWRIVAGSNAI